MEGLCAVSLLLGDSSARWERPKVRSALRGSPGWNPAPAVTHCAGNIRFRPLCLSLILTNLLIRVTKASRRLMERGMKVTMGLEMRILGTGCLIFGLL